MAATQLNSDGIGEIRRNDLDVTTTGQALIAKVIAGTNISISSTGVDSGTGDVTLNVPTAASGVAGVVSASAQTITGFKTFEDNVKAAQATFLIGSLVDGPATIPLIWLGQTTVASPTGANYAICFDQVGGNTLNFNSLGGVAFRENNDPFQQMTWKGKSLGIGYAYNYSPAVRLDVSGDIRSSNLAGTGTRMVVADSSGILSSQAIPSGTYSRSVSSISTNTIGGSTASTDYVYICTGSFTFTLPTAVGNTNLYTIKNAGTGFITLATTSSQLIEGVAASANDPIKPSSSLDFISDGSNWYII